MRKMVLVGLGILVVAFVIAAAQRLPNSSAYTEEAAAIADFDDCVALQARFDGWYRNRHDFKVGVATSSMEADDDRMRDIGCYD